MKLKPLTAKDTLEKFVGLAEKLWPSQEVMFNVSTEIPNVGFQVEIHTSQLREQPLVTEFAGLVAKRGYLLASRAQLKARNNHGRGFDYTCSDGLVADLVLQGATTQTEGGTWLAAVEEHFTFSNYLDRAGAHAASSAERDALQIRERASADIQAATVKLGELLAKIAEDDLEHRRQLNAQLEADYRSKADELNAAHQKRVDEVEGRRRSAEDAIAERERTFTAKVKEFETDEARLVRRQLLTRLMDVLKESETLELSAGTAKKRAIVHQFTWALIAAAAVLATSMGAKFWEGGADAWHYAIPMATGTVTLFATLIYYLKWNDRWFREHAEGEFASKRYKSDMLRASWLAELVSERAQAKQPDLPPELLEAFTQNLFRGSTPLAEAEHPFEQLTSLIKHAKELKIGKGELSLRAGKAKTRNADNDGAA